MALGTTPVLASRAGFSSARLGGAEVGAEIVDFSAMVVISASSPEQTTSKPWLASLFRVLSSED